MKYILVTLIGGHKLYSMPLFWEHMQKLKTQPSKILVSCTEEIFKEAVNPYDGSVPVIWIHGDDDTGDDRIHSTTSAREALRKELIQLPYDWSMWLDNDILVPPDMVEKFEFLLTRDPKLLWVNAYHPARQPGGESGRMRHGLGSSFIHRDLLEAVPFIHYKLHGRNLGDDFPWKLIVGHLVRFSESTSMSGILFDVKHAVEDGSIHEFIPKQRLEMNEVYST